MKINKNNLKYIFIQKAVDVWACGIVLFMVCNEGRHPFYKKEESKSIFLEKLQNPPRDFKEDFEE